MIEEQNTKETTQQLLRRLYGKAMRCKSGKRYGMTKDELLKQYEELKHISETLTAYELYLIYYLRGAGNGKTFGFMEIAKKLYEANQALEKIKNRL